MKKPAVLFILLSLLWACGGQLEEEVAEKYQDGKVKRIYFYKEKAGKREMVKELKYFQNGQKEFEGNYMNGVKHGEWTYWFDNGEIQSEGFFKNGLRDGKSFVYNREGKKYYTGEYKMGKKTGVWYFYNREGKKLKEVEFLNGEKISEKTLQEGTPLLESDQ